MNTAETIAAAIQKLEELKVESTQPTDGNAWIQGRDSRRYESSHEVYTGPDENTEGSADIVAYIETADAELIVTLHRTIDAQLKALRSAEWLLGRKSDPTAYTHAATASIIDLARAILGGAA